MNNNRWQFVSMGFWMMLTLGLVNAWSVFVLPLEHEFGWSRNQTSLAFSLAMIFVSCGILSGGALSDRQGPKLVCTVAGTAIGLGFILVSFVNSLLQLYIVYSLICGLACGIIYNCVVSTLIRWFPDKRGLVSGILMMGFGFGGLVLGIGASLIIDTTGWRYAFRILGALSLVSIVGIGRFLRLPVQTWPRPVESGDIEFLSAEYDWRSVLRLPAFWLIWLWQVTIIVGGLSAIGHIVPLAIEQGIALTAAAYALGCLSVFNGLGRVVFGSLSDRLGNKRTMFVAAVAMMLAMAALAVLPPRWGFGGLVAAAALAGFAYGGSMPQVSSVIAAFFGQKHFGANFGLASTGIIVASLLGPYLLGYIKTVTGGYEMGLYFLSAAALCGCIIAAAVRRPQAANARLPEALILAKGRDGNAGRG